jgi:hypothetical protein
MFKTYFLPILLIASLNASAHVFSPIIQAAKLKGLPTKILNEMVQYNSNIAIKKTSGGASYKPGFFSGGTIYLPFSVTTPRNWKAIDWTLFYNEAFHAWWGTVFTKQNKYSNEKYRLVNDSALKAKYRRAHPKNPILAMEEGYSETLASVILMAYPRLKLDSNGKLVPYSPDFETLYYKKGKTVAPVSHSDRPGFTPAAENTYLNHEEYSMLMVWVFDRAAPPILD